MIDPKKTMSLQPFENRYQTVLLAARRSRQLLDRAEKHGMSADTSRVIGQALEEILSGKVTMKPLAAPASKKKSREKSEG